MSSSPKPLPANIFKILPGPPPAPFPSTGLPASDLDTNDGFLHTSTASVVPRTSDMFFGSVNRIWILKLSTDALKGQGAEVRWEGPEGCVHVYAGEGHEGLAQLDEGNVSASRMYERSEGQSWKEVFERADRWLVDQDGQ